MKFSFLKRGDGDKPTQPTKRASRSGTDGGAASVKAFLVNHLEKILLTVITAMSLMIIYSGFSKKRLDSNPEQLEVAVSSAERKINDSPWSAVRQERYPKADTFDQQATADTEDIKEEDFQLPVPFHPIMQQRQKRRSDPQLIAPVEIEVRAGYGPLTIGRAAGAGPERVSNFLRTQGGSGDNTRPLPDKYRQGSRSDSPTESAYFVAITGLVPLKQQSEAYREAFEGAAEFLAERDTPTYLALRIQRAEVGADGQPGEWSNVNAFRVMQKEPDRWDGTVEERVSAEHIVERLVMPVPPLKFRDVSQWATHSKIPIRKAGRDGFLRDDGAPDGPEVTRPADEPLDLFGSATSPARDMELDEDAESAEDSVAERQPVEGELAATRPKVEFGLLRFFDLTVEPGKSYIYRVQLILEDPNNPRQSSRPSASSCETSVVVRRQAEPKKYYVETPWSEDSPAVTLPSGRSVLAGSVVQPRLYSVSDSNPRIRLPRRPGEEPEATVMAVIWDPAKVMDVPAEIPIRRGSVINGTVTTEAIDTSQSNIRKLENYELKTNALVLDIAGGEPLGGTAKLRAPGLILLMTSDGQLVFRNEVLDYEQFEYHTIPEDEEKRRQRERDAATLEREEENLRGRGRGGRGRGQNGGDEPVLNEGPRGRRNGGRR